MAALLLVLAVLLVSPACGGGGENRVEIEALGRALGMTPAEWDLHVPRETGAGLTPRGIVATLRDAALFNRDRLVGIVEREAAAP